MYELYTDGLGNLCVESTDMGWALDYADWAEETMSFWPRRLPAQLVTVSVHHDGEQDAHIVWTRHV